MARKNTIEIIINAKDNASAVLSGAASNIQSIGKAATIAAAAGIAAATVAVTAFASKSVSAFTGFQNSMNEVFTLLPDLSNEAMADMEAGIQRLSRVFGTMTDDAVPALYQAISAGVPKENVFKFLEVANKAAIGGVTSLETAVDGITSVVNAYGSEILSASQASDLMFTAVKLGKTDFEQLSASLSMVTPTAASMGLGFDNVAAAMSTMTAQGINTAASTTALNGLLVEIADSGSDVGKTFAQVAGVGFRDFITQGGNLSDALGLLEQAATDTGVPIDEMFGNVRAGKAALALTGRNAQRFADDIAAMGDSAGATEVAFERMSMGTQAQIDRLKAATQNLFIDTGRLLDPFVGRIISGMADVINIFSNFLEGVEITGENLKDLLNETPRMFRPLVRALAPVITAFSRLAIDIDPNNPNGFFGALKNGMSVVEAAGITSRRFFRILGFGQEATVKLGLFVENLISSIQLFRTEGVPIVTKLSVLFAGMIEAVTGGNVAFSSAFAAAQLFFGAINTAISPITDWIKNTIEMKDIMIAFGIAIATFVIPAIAGIIAGLITMAAPFVALVAAVALLRTAWENNFLGIQEKTASFVESVKSFFSGLSSSIREGGLVGAVEFLRDRIVSGFESIDWVALAASVLTGLGSLLTGMANLIVMMFDTAKAVLGSINWAQLGFDIVELIFSPFTGGGDGGIDWGAIFNTFMSALGTAALAAFDFLAWTVTNIIAPLILGLLTGIVQTDWGEVISSIFDALKAAVVGAVNFIAWVAENLIIPIINASITAISNADWSAIGSGILNSIARTFGDIGAWANANIIQPIVSTIRNFDFGAAVSGAIGSVGGFLNPFDGNALGGAVSAGVPTIVGETGREMFVPQSDGQIVNNRDTESAISGGGGSTNMTININGIPSRADAQEAATVVVRALRAQGVTV